MLAYVVRRDSARLRLSEERLATTLRSIGDAVIATDERGTVTMINPIAEKLTGWRLADARGKPLDEIFRIVNEQTRETVESPVAKVLREGGIVGLANHTVLIHRAGHETAIEDSGAPICDDAGAITGVVLVFRDATEERAAKNALLLADRKKDEFLATLAHELRNPLAPIRQAAALCGPSGHDARADPLESRGDRAADRAHGAPARRPARCLANYARPPRSSPRAHRAAQRGRRRRGNGAARHRRRQTYADDRVARRAADARRRRAAHLAGAGQSADQRREIHRAPAARSAWRPNALATRS